MFRTLARIVFAFSTSLSLPFGYGAMAGEGNIDLGEFCRTIGTTINPTGAGANCGFGQVRALEAIGDALCGKVALPVAPVGEHSYYLHGELNSLRTCPGEIENLSWNSGVKQQWGPNTLEELTACESRWVKAVNGRWPEAGGHSVIAFNQNGKLEVWCPQSGTIHPGEEYLRRFERFSTCTVYNLPPDGVKVTLHRATHELFEEMSPVRNMTFRPKNMTAQQPKCGTRVPRGGMNPRVWAGLFHPANLAAMLIEPMARDYLHRQEQRLQREMGGQTREQAADEYYQRNNPFNQWREDVIKRPDVYYPDGNYPPWLNEALGIYTPSPPPDPWALPRCNWRDPVCIR